MSSFHQVGLIAKGKVKDCRRLCEGLEMYEEEYKLKGEDGKTLDFESADDDLFCEFSYCQERKYPVEVGDFSSENMDVKVLNIPLEPDGSKITYIHSENEEVKEFYVVVDEGSYEYFEQLAEEDGEDWAPGYGEGEEWISAEKKFEKDFAPIWESTFKALFRQAGYTELSF